MKETTKRELLQKLSGAIAEISASDHPDYHLISSLTNVIHQLVRNAGFNKP